MSGTADTTTCVAPDCTTRPTSVARSIAAWLMAVLWLLPNPLTVYWGWLVLFVALQAARVWVIATLGPYWTTRIISVPDAPLIKNGPYRFVRHPGFTRTRTPNAPAVSSVSMMWR